MSRIESVKQNFPKTPNFGQAQTKFSDRQYFGSGGGEVSEQVIKEADFIRKTYGPKYIENKIGPWGWFSRITQKLKKNDGEIQTQKTNAIFTCTLAPAFIAFNPISTQDKKTKYYTALRQPISALNAIIFVFAMTKPIDFFMENIATKGFIKPLDLRINPDKSYLEREFKDKYNKAEKKNELEAFLNKFAKEDERKTIKEDIQIFHQKISDEKPTNVSPKTFAKDQKKALMDLYVKKRQDAAKEFFTRLKSEAPESIMKDVNRINEAKEEYYVENMADYLDKNNLHKMGFKTFMKDKFNVEFVKEITKENGKTEVKLTLKEENFEKQKLKTIKAMDFLREMGLVFSERGDDGKYTDKSFNEDQLKKFLNYTYQEQAVRQEKLTCYDVKNRQNKAVNFLHTHEFDTEKFDTEKLNKFLKLEPEEPLYQIVNNAELKDAEKEIKIVELLRERGLVNENFTEKDVKGLLSIHPKASLKKLIEENRITEIELREKITERGKGTATLVKFNLKSNEETVTLDEMIKTLGIKPETLTKDIQDDKKMATVMKEFAQKLKNMDGFIGNDLKEIAQQIVDNKDNEKMAEVMKDFAKKIKDNMDGFVDKNLKETAQQIVDAKEIKGDKKMEAVVKEFAKKLKNNVEGFVSNNSKKIAGQIINTDAKALTQRFKGMKQYGAIFFNLFGAAVACTSLNWMYPRIVEKLFPNLVKDEPAKKGGNK